jgi:hypothetical protein
MHELKIRINLHFDCRTTPEYSIVVLVMLEGVAGKTPEDAGLFTLRLVPGYLTSFSLAHYHYT